MFAITWRPVVLYQKGPLCLGLARRLRLEVSQVGCQMGQRPWREPQVLQEQGPQGHQKDHLPWREPQELRPVLAHQKDQNPSLHRLQEEWWPGLSLRLQWLGRLLHRAL